MTKITIIFNYGRYNVHADDFLLFSGLHTVEECYQRVAEYYYHKGNVQVAEFYV